MQRLATADLVHVDIMDNHFVPNLTFGLPMVERLQQVTPVPLDIHLMIDDVDRWAPASRRRAPRASPSTPRPRASPSRSPGACGRSARAGIALKPGTPSTTTSTSSTSSTRCS
ncbi:hypothetical protein [Clavibacter tessellarius]|uniref:hypothetical protein n=1 Tax=Clavibacter tessellarius TaxID=31965 RepID=UPI0039BF6655